MKPLRTPYLLIIILIFELTNVFGQLKALDRMVTLEIKDMSLGHLFEKLQQDYQVKLVYGAKNFPENKRINMKANNESLRHFLDRLCFKEGLSYKVVDEYVIFESKNPASVDRHVASPIPKVIVVSEKFVTKPDTIQFDSLPAKPRALPINEEQMIVIRELAATDRISLPSSSQIKRSIINYKAPDVKKQKKTSSYRAAVYASYDHHLFRFNTLPDQNQKYKSEFNSSFGSLFSVHLQRRTLIGIGFIYSSKRISFHRNFRILNLSDAVSIPDVTSISCTYMEIPVEFECRIVHFKKLNVHLASGISTAFLFDKEETSTYLTQGEPATAYFINQSNSFLWGPQVALRVEYPIVKSFAFFISPHYIHYNKSVNDAITHSGTDLLRLQAGVQLNIKRS